MTDDHFVQARDSPPSARLPRRDFAWLSKLIARRTTDVLVIVILGFALLASGDKLRDWWLDDQGPHVHPELAAENFLGHALPWGADGRPVAIDFGSSPYTVQRQTIRGDASVATQSLLASCRWHSEHASDPVTPATDQELALLTKLAGQDPVARGPHWQLHRIDYPTQMFVGLRQYPTASVSNPAVAQQTPTDRVVCWGILFPFSDQQWTTFLFHPIQTSGAFDMPQFELPESAKAQMCLRSSTAGVFVAFDGPGPVGDWKNHFETWFTAHRGVQIRDWTTDEQCCSARFTLGHDSTPVWIDVLFSRIENHRLSGLIMATRQHSGQQRGNP